MLAIKTILHPTDFSEPSGYALNLACGLAADYGANLVITHVISASSFPSPERVLAGIRQKLDALEIVDDGIDVTRRIEEGNPATEILNLAELCHADLIVMGFHNRHGLQRWFMRSIAEEVVRRATCPVLTVTTEVASRLRCDNARCDNASRTMQPASGPPVAASLLSKAQRG